MRGAPWPVRIMVIGDSYSTNPGQPDWQEQALQVFPPPACQVILEDYATSGKCLFDTTGILGADTVAASIDADLAASPNSDIVVWASACGNDILRNKTLDNTITEANLIGAADYVMSAITAAKKGLVVMGVPMVQAFINGFGAGDATSAQSAYEKRLAINAHIQTQCGRVANRAYWLPRWAYNDFGPLVSAGQNGIKAEFNEDGLHFNKDANQYFVRDIFGCISNLNIRRKIAA